MLSNWTCVLESIAYALSRLELKMRRIAFGEE